MDNETFGGLRVRVVSWMPKDSFVLFTPGESRDVIDKFGNWIRTEEVKPPQFALTVNVGGHSGQ